jgi:hypothetical protein
MRSPRRTAWTALIPTQPPARTRTAMTRPRLPAATRSGSTGRGHARSIPSSARDARATTRGRRCDTAVSSVGTLRRRPRRRRRPVSRRATSAIPRQARPRAGDVVVSDGPADADRAPPRAVNLRQAPPASRTPAATPATSAAALQPAAGHQPRPAGDAHPSRARSFDTKKKKKQEACPYASRKGSSPAASGAARAVGRCQVATVRQGSAGAPCKVATPRPW